MSEISTESTQIRKPLPKYHWKCVVCNSADDRETMLLCDKCDKGYHVQCLGLADLPEENHWFCDHCIDKVKVPNKVRASSKEIRQIIRDSVQLVDGEDAANKDALYTCWLCDKFSKYPKSRAEEFVAHLKSRHGDHELAPQILKAQQIHLLIKEKRGKGNVTEVPEDDELQATEAGPSSAERKPKPKKAKRKKDAAVPEDSIIMTKKELKQLLAYTAEAAERQLKRQKSSAAEGLAEASSGSVAAEQQLAEVAKPEASDEPFIDTLPAEPVTEAAAAKPTAAGPRMTKISPGPKYDRVVLDVVANLAEAKLMKIEEALNTADMACEMYCYRSIVDGERAQARFLKRLQEVPLPQELQGELQIDEAKQTVAWMPAKGKRRGDV